MLIFMSFNKLGFKQIRFYSLCPQGHLVLTFLVFDIISNCRVHHSQGSTLQNLAHDDAHSEFFFKLFIYLFLAVPGRLCSVSFSPVGGCSGRASHRHGFSSCRGSQALGPLASGTQHTSSAVVAPGLESAGSRAVVHGLAAPRPVRSSPTR